MSSPRSRRPRFAAVELPLAALITLLTPATARYAAPTVSPTPTFGSLSASPLHRSFFRDGLQRLAGARPLDDWLVEEANVRGHFGAVGRTVPDRPPTARLSDESLIVALLMPHTPADGRLFKLALRMLQRAALDAAALWFQARRERADRVLYWLLQQIPEPEQTEGVRAVMAAISGPPRGYQGLRYNYDGSRLIRRPATKESVWRAARR